MKLAVLGAGGIVPDFLEAASKIPRAEICAIYGRESSRSRMLAYQAQYGIPHLYMDYGQLLEDRQVEGVYVALPNHLHHEFAKKALEAKKHAIIEKPFASNGRQARELVELAEKNGVFVFEAISNLYMPNYKKTRELVKGLGKVKVVQMNFSQYSSRYDKFKEGVVLPVFDPEQSGGALMDINVYNVHFILGLFGKPQKISYHANIERGIDTSGVLLLEYPGFQCVAVGAKDCQAPASISIQGEEGYLYSTQPTNVYDGFSLGKGRGETEDFALNGGFPRLYHELMAFVGMVEGRDGGLFCKASRHSLDVMDVLDEARRQAGVAIGPING